MHCLFIGVSVPLYKIIEFEHHIVLSLDMRVIYFRSVTLNMTVSLNMPVNSWPPLVTIEGDRWALSSFSVMSSVLLYTYHTAISQMTIQWCNKRIFSDVIREHFTYCWKFIRTWNVCLISYGFKTQFINKNIIHWSIDIHFIFSIVNIEKLYVCLN